MPRNLAHTFGRVFNTPLAVQPARLEALLAGLHAASMARGSRLDPVPLALEAIEGLEPFQPSIGARSGDDRRPARKPYAMTPAGVALLPVHGILVKRAGQVTADSTEIESYARIGGLLRAAIGDPAVTAIMLDVDSWGGEVGGLFELVADIRTAGTIKPVWASINDHALSAGYAIASAASRVWSSDVGSAGSVGVVAMHTDQSGADAAAGRVYTYVYAGERKIDGNPHAPLGRAARASLQAEVDRIYGGFVDLVANHRGLDAGAVRKTQAALYHGPHAVAAGLVDQLGTLAQAVHALGDSATGSGRISMMSETTQTLPAATAPDPAPPVPAPVPVPEPAQAASTVVNLDAVREATGLVRREASEIAALCDLAGMSSLAAEFIQKDTPLYAVRADLARRRAEADEARQVQTVDTSPKPGVATSTSELNTVLGARWASQMGRT